MELIRKNTYNDCIKYYFVLEDFKDCNALEVQIFYDKGGINYWNDKIEKRGYYISLQPCSLQCTTIRSMPSDGVKKFIKEVGRKSKKAFATAREMVNIQDIIEMVNYKDYPVSLEEVMQIVKTIKSN